MLVYKQLFTLIPFTVAMPAGQIIGRSLYKNSAELIILRRKYELLYGKYVSGGTQRLSTDSLKIQLDKLNSAIFKLSKYTIDQLAELDALQTIGLLCEQKRNNSY